MQYRALGITKVTSGILNPSLVHPRGDPTPSPDDRQITTQLVSAGRILDIPVFDHIIIAGTTHLSFAEAGLL